jgi:type IV pilus assembly protein PilC
MPTFAYTVRDRAGKISNGSLQATDVNELRRILRSNDLYLTEYKSSGGDTSTGREQKPGLFGSTKIKLQDMVIVTRQLATLLRSGVPLTQGIEIVREQTNKPQLIEALRDMQAGVVGGEGVSTMMRKHPKVFNDLICSLVEAGEAAGNLDFALDVAADQLDREDELRRKVKAATTYPKLVVGASIGTVLIMLLCVVPVFSTVYKSLNTELPSMTKLLITLSDWVVQFWWLVFAGLFGINFGFKKYYATSSGKKRVDALTLRIPVMGPIFRKISIARFTQTLAGSMRAGVPVLRSLQISANTAGNAIIRDAVHEVAANVRDGSQIGIELEKSGHFPLMVTRMITAGEASGNVDEMLDEINRFYERDVAYSVEQLTKMIEPLMTIVVGGIVLFVLLALYMPVFSLGEAFRSSEKK